MKTTFLRIERQRTVGTAILLWFINEGVWQTEKMKQGMLKFRGSFNRRSGIIIANPEVTDEQLKLIDELSPHVETFADSIEAILAPTQAGQLEGKTSKRKAKRIKV